MALLRKTSWLTSALFVTCALCAAPSAQAGDKPSDKPADKPKPVQHKPSGDEKSSPAGDCVQARNEARFDGYAYDHWVHLTNGCKKPMTCSVKTNVNPQPSSVDLAVDEQKSLMTFMGSPAREFQTDVSCHPQG